MSAAAALPAVYLADALSQLIDRDNPAAPPWELLLWTADIEPAAGSTLGELGEVTWGGYERRTIQRDEWGEPVVAGACAASTPAPAPYLWTSGGPDPETVRGWALWEPLTSRLVLIVRLPEANELVVAPGSTYRLTPRFTLAGGLC